MTSKPIVTRPRRLLADPINRKGGSLTAASSFSFLAFDRVAQRARQRITIEVTRQEIILCTAP